MVISNSFNDSKVKIEILNRANQSLARSYVSPSYMLEWLSDNLTNDVMERTVNVVIEGKSNRFIAIQPKTFREFIEKFNEKCFMISMNKILEV